MLFKLVSITQFGVIPPTCPFWRDGSHLLYLFSSLHPHWFSWLFTSLTVNLTLHVYLFISVAHTCISIIIRLLIVTHWTFREYRNVVLCYEGWKIAITLLLLELCMKNIFEAFTECSFEWKSDVRIHCNVIHDYEVSHDNTFQ